jgi:hypothetical protein
LKDLGVSAFRGRNADVGDWGALIKMARQGTFQSAGIKHVLVEGFDRMSRMKPIKALTLFNELLETGMIVHTIKDRQIFTSESINETGQCCCPSCTWRQPTLRA